MFLHGFDRLIMHETKCLVVPSSVKRWTLIHWRLDDHDSNATNQQLRIKLPINSLDDRESGSCSLNTWYKERMNDPRIGVNHDHWPCDLLISPLIFPGVGLYIDFIFVWFDHNYLN